MDFYGALLAKSMSGGGGSSLPPVTSDDNGDVLTVVDGAWDKAEVPKELPTVTSVDNGDVLTVVDGAWEKSTPSGGGCNVELFEVSYSSPNYKLENNKTMADIITAMNQRKVVILQQYVNNKIYSTLYSLNDNGNPMFFNINTSGVLSLWQGASNTSNKLNKIYPTS